MPHRSVTDSALPAADPAVPPGRFAFPPVRVVALVAALVFLAGAVGHRTEDLYELSERLDNVLDAAKDTVREAEVMGMAPDGAMAEMARLVADGAGQLSAALAHLGVDADQATTDADAAIKCERTLEKAYRSAMSTLLALDDWKEVAGRRELYRRCARLGDAVTLVAERIWYAVVKEAPCGGAIRQPVGMMTCLGTRPRGSL